MAAPTPSTHSYDPTHWPGPCFYPSLASWGPMALLSTTLEPACSAFSFHAVVSLT